MSNPSEIRIVLGSLRYASNNNQGVWVQPPLFGSNRQYVEGDRTILVDQQVIFDNERQSSEKFRIAGKIVNVINNDVSGKTSYSPYKNNLYYTNPINNAISSLLNPTFPWEGYPQFNEFTISRNEGIPGHIPFVNKSASSYNWSFYLTYAFSSTTAQTMSFTSEQFNVTNNNFVCGDGVPYVLTTGTLNGKSLIYFYCGTKHNLKVGESIELSVPINNQTIFTVYSLGDGSYNSEENVFTIYDLKFNPNDVQTGTYGTLKRISNIINSGETKSIYYVRLHKIIKTPNECNISRAGFENNPFFVKKKVEYAEITPNQTERLSVKDGTQTYSFTFDTDVSIAGLVDNNGKPITELFVTAVQRGYMGWFNKPFFNQNTQLTGLEVGWGFNFLKNSIDNWWDKNSVVNKDNIPVGSYNTNGQTFYYNEHLNVGDVVKGDFCEFNYLEQKEYVLSKMYHKYSFNDLYFSDNSTPNLPSGYLYEPHTPIQIRTFSDYLEFGSKEFSDNVPGYAWFSEFEDTWYWRDLYTYGFIDNDGIGVDYPFLNGSHYPFKDILFLQYPIQRDNNVQSTIINRITNDDCE
jgi:hypothetical protein